MIKFHLDKHFVTPTTSSSNVSEMEHRVVSHKGTKLFPFTEKQLSKLRKRFKISPFIQGKEKELLASKLGIPPSSVLSWFRYQRKLKQYLAKEARNATVVTA